MLRQHLQSIQQWYRTTDWDEALATAVVTWVFALPGATLAEYTGVAHYIREGAFELAFGWLGAILMGVVAATLATPALLAGRAIRRRVVSRPFFGLSAAVVLSVGCLLSTVLWWRNINPVPDTFTAFAQTELLVGIVWWGLALGTASVGLWLRDNRPRVRTGTAPTAAILLVGMVVLAGTSAGMVGPIADDDSTEPLYPSPQNASGYADGKEGPMRPLNTSRTDPVPLSSSAFACESVVEPPGHIPAAEYDVTANATIERSVFDDGDGESVPNRVWVNIPIPQNSTVLEVRWGTLGAHTGYDTVSYDDEVSAGIIATEWDKPGFVSVTVVTENHTTERYWATLCPSREVS